MQFPVGGANFVAPRFEKVVKLLLFAMECLKILLRWVGDECGGLRLRGTIALGSSKRRVAAAETTRRWGSG